MKKAVVSTLFLALLCFGFAGVAKADSCPGGSTNCLAAGGVTYTFTNTTDASDPAGTFDISMTISGNTTSGPGTLSAFAVQFGVGGPNASNVTLESVPAGTGTWTFSGNAPTGPTGCGASKVNNPFWCFTGGSISFPAAGTFTFVFDVTIPGTNPPAPDFADIHNLQGTGLSISDNTGIGGGKTPSVPEPASIILLGFGLAGAPFLRRRK